MRFFRRREEETLNEQLLRDAGLDQAQTPDAQPPQEPAAAPASVQWQGFDATTGMYPVEPRTSDYDAVVTARAPQLAGDVVEFATLPNGDVIVDEEQGDADLSPLAEAVEREVRPPYRASGRNEGDGLWAVAARGIDVLQFRFDQGDSLELVRHAGEQRLRVDGEPSSARIPELEQAGEAVGGDYAVAAERLDGDFWEVRTGAL